MRDLRWYLVSQPPRPEVALIFPGSTTQKKDCHVRPCYVCNEHPDVIWMVQPGGAKEKLRGTRETSRQKMETSLIKGAKIAKIVCFWKVITTVFLGLWTTKKSWKSLRYAFPHPSICLHHHVICSWTLDEIEQNIMSKNKQKYILYHPNDCKYILSAVIEWNTKLKLWTRIEHKNHSVSCP